ncbi:MAG: hypothetical protein N4A74_01655 [Carboxylicivirga sp.]|jgi:hypothetical protein|nr:hypothetical protein [Carboxylicivirga sp.]
MKKLLFLIAIVLNFAQINAQNSSALAEGYYLKAKAQYKERAYSNVIRYAHKAMTELGGTNLELQYLLTMSYVAQEDWKRAEREAKKYAEVDNFSTDITIKDFDETVPCITKEEKQKMAKMMVRITEGAEKIRQKEEAARNYKSSPEYTRDTLIKRVNRLYEQLVTFDSNLENDKVNHSIIIKEQPQTFKYNVTVKLYSNAKRSKGHYVYNISFNLYDLQLESGSPISVNSNAEQKFINMGSGGKVAIDEVYTASEFNAAFSFSKAFEIKEIFYGSKTEYQKGNTDQIVLPVTKNLSEEKAKQLAEDLSKSLKDLKAHNKKHNLRIK